MFWIKAFIWMKILQLSWQLSLKFPRTACSTCTWQAGYSGWIQRQARFSFDHWRTGSSLCLYAWYICSVPLSDKIFHFLTFLIPASSQILLKSQALITMEQGVQYLYWTVLSHWNTVFSGYCMLKQHPFKTPGKTKDGSHVSLWRSICASLSLGRTRVRE